MEKNESTVLPLISSIIYMILDIIYMNTTKHESFLIEIFRSSIVLAIIVSVVLFVIIFAMSKWTDIVSLGIAVPLTIITYIGGLRSVPLFSLQGVIYIWLTMLIFSFLIHTVFNRDMN